MATTAYQHPKAVHPTLARDLVLPLSATQPSPHTTTLVRPPAQLMRCRQWILTLPITLWTIILRLEVQTTIGHLSFPVLFGPAHRHSCRVLVHLGQAPLHPRDRALLRLRTLVLDCRPHCSQPFNDAKRLSLSLTEACLCNSSNAVLPRLSGNHDGHHSLTQSRCLGATRLSQDPRATTPTKQHPPLLPFCIV